MVVWQEATGQLVMLKITNLFNFDSFGGQPDKFLINQFFKPKICHNYKLKIINSKFCVC